ncbi:hypothetical protein ABD81_30010 [Bacillus thuringiensis]|uniref:DUF4238 domain-containing protein n=1 Tax=Bacillus wiedmannii TaxID=1890302 RepID=A0A242YZ28_9BACI|nr:MULTISPECIES: DUF4238 domain-containing protein [Bacillus cereus group]MBG9749532.1 hypothetical protein [Bacillus thuringiensis]MBG9781975.1 hypothetical protein [Bacillus thuringiensis]OTX84881.1 hypothetical protein BK730_24200 [Bacillus wiedmannii]OTZ80684.1 hypothetical protein BK771_32985 [Bacillus thuringiensis serovar ostriniae]
MAEKKEFVKKQHYIPQFSIRPFEITKGYCLAVNLETKPFEILEKKTENIMQEYDLYEVKDNNGKYVNRNEMEDIYSKLENSIARRFRKLIDVLESDKADIEFNKIVKDKTVEWAKDETNLLFHLILTLIRSPHLKNLIDDNKEIPDFMKPIHYLLMTTGQNTAVKFAKELYIGDKLEYALHFLKTNPESGLKLICEHLMNNFQLRIYKIRGEKNFFLSDRPILVNKFEEADYVLPISPKICIGTTPLKIKKGKVSVYSQITYMSDDDVNRINKKIIENTEKMLIIQCNADLEFVKEFGEI